MKPLNHGWTPIYTDKKLKSSLNGGEMSPRGEPIGLTAHFFVEIGVHRCSSVVSSVVTNECGASMQNFQQQMR
jgi:hypothetical protein